MFVNLINFTAVSSLTAYYMQNHLSTQFSHNIKIIIKLNKNKEKIVCYNYNKLSHYKNQCFNLTKNTNCVTLNKIKLKKKN